MAGQIPVALSILAKLGVVVCDVGEVLSLMTFAFRMSKSHLTASGKVDTIVLTRLSPVSLTLMFL